MNNNEDRWKYEKVDINLIDNAEINANKMSDEFFDTLCENIGMSGLSSVPCCYKKEDGRFVMISGHHRLKACKKLGYKKIGILYLEESELSKDEILAIQLSHNSLHGEDDKGILKRMFAQIQSIDFKKFAHINMDEIGSVNANNLSIMPVKENYTIAVILYNDSSQYFDELIGDINELTKKNDVVIMAEQEPNEELFLKLRKEIKDKLDIKSSSVAFGTILKLAYQQLMSQNYDLDSND